MSSPLRLSPSQVVDGDFADFADFGGGFGDFDGDFGGVDARISTRRHGTGDVRAGPEGCRAAACRLVATCRAAGDAPPERARRVRAAPAAPHRYFKVRSL